MFTCLHTIMRFIRLGRIHRTKVVEDSSGWIIVNQEDCNMSCSESGSDDMPLGAQVTIKSKSLCAFSFHMSILVYFNNLLRETWLPGHWFWKVRGFIWM